MSVSTILAICVGQSVRSTKACANVVIVARFAARFPNVDGANSDLEERADLVCQLRIPLFWGISMLLRRKNLHRQLA